jgi:hypothetical protein
MAPRRKTKPTKASNEQIIDFTATLEDSTIECELPIDQELLRSPQPPAESRPQPPAESRPPTPSLFDQPDRIKWTALME